MSKTVQTNLLTDQIANREEIRRVFGKAVKNALMDHKCAGNPVAAWIDGKVVWVAPEDIIIPPDEEDAS